MFVRAAEQSGADICLKEHTNLHFVIPIFPLFLVQLGLLSHKVVTFSCKFVSFVPKPLFFPSNMVIILCFSH